MEEVSSRLLNQVIEQFNTLPGVGKRTAMRLALHMINKEPHEIEKFAMAFQELTSGVNFCKRCYNISDLELCSICSNSNRNSTEICVVEDIRDVIAIESTMQYKGVYHVLGGKISPMDGIGPSNLRISELIDRVNNESINEIILALSTTMEGDTTNFYLYRKLKDFGIKITTIARGISVGDELEFADEITLGRSLVNRIPYENSVAK